MSFDPNEIHAALARMGLTAPGERPDLEPLTGGVSSTILRVALPSGPVCVKQALARLKVAAEWFAPVERYAAEVAWIRAAAAVEPAMVPAILGEDPQARLFVLSWLDPARYPVWKAQLLAGKAEPATARAVAARLAAVHRATAGEPEVARRFAHDETFHAIRLEPYLLATARRHPDVAAALERLAADTLAGKRTLVHGDVSPKNLLVGPQGPVFLDAECAWYGDPAFDLAFCLNHLLLKCVARRDAAPALLGCFDALAAEYLGGVSWEDPAAIEARTARLLPGLFLARVDGKSPVEYITLDADRERIRRTALPLLRDPPDRLAAVRLAWEEQIKP